ncbi:MAG: Holliday junction branch migration protein RuvA [Cyanobacteria bacterium SIG26]|nr:Holliday junction branch migration protein RuvA [Cyanobacteria bacterium SIG26]
MYDYFKGFFAHKICNAKGCFATVDVGGVGYILEIMDRDFAKLPVVGEDVKLYSVLIHREDKMALCGFLKREDRDIFNILTSVSGVGSKMALTLLNSFDVSDLVGFVLDGDYKELTKAKGVGPKLAQKIILELKDKLTSYQESAPIEKIKSVTTVNPQNIEDAQLVMLSLGYAKDEVSDSISKAVQKISSTASAEEILKEALKILSV